MPIAITDEQRALQDSIRAALHKKDGQHWQRLTQLGVFEMTLDASIVDVAVALEQVTDSLAPGPITPTLLAGSTKSTGVQIGDVVLGAGEAEQLLLKGDSGWFLVPAAEAEITVLDALDLTRTLAKVTASGGVSVDGKHLEQLIPIFFAAEASGVAGWCVRTAADYAKIREQFGRPIGSFQAIKHLCVSMLTRSEQAAAVAWDAAMNPDDELAAAVAVSIAVDAAVENAKDCIQVLGGIGFTWEHEAHLYLRRALSIRHLLGGTAKWREKVATLTLAGARRQHAAQETTLDFSHLASLSKAEQRVALADEGLLESADPQVFEALHRAGVERPNLGIASWAIATIRGHGTDEQRERFIKPSLRGELMWCQLFSEPNAGSDLAALRMKALKVEGGWRLTGQKVWTSNASQAQWAICLARTDTQVPKHKGISYFLVDMSTPGIDIRPLKEITGEALFNEVFLDDVFVPDDCLVGQPGDGWRLARTTLANERVQMGRGSLLGDAVEKLVAKATEPTEQLGALIAEGHSVSLMDMRKTDPTIGKLVGVKHRQNVAEALLELHQGAYRTDENAEAIYQFLLTRCLSIAGGTTQILMSVAGERILGLPREPQ